MDPDANLSEQLGIAHQIIEVWDDCCGDGTLTKDQAEYVSYKANRLAELVLELDHWIDKGGYLPLRWRQGK